MSILRQNFEILSQQVSSKTIQKLLKENIVSKEYVEYQFLQKSKIPTMHFQKSLPRLPIPKLDSTCDRYLAAQRPLLTTEAFQKTQFNVNHFKHTSGKLLQDMLKNYDRQNYNSSYISEFWFDSYLCDRKPIPINYNPVLVMHKDGKPEFNDQLIRTCNLIISSLRFHRSLKSGLLEPEVFHMNPKKSDTEQFRTVCSNLPDLISWYAAYLYKAYPLDMSQYPSLFGTTRIPETDRDRLINSQFSKHITVQYKNHFYSFRVLLDNGDILPPEQILARLKLILEDSIPVSEFPVGILTTLERNKWASLRHKLWDNGNDNILKIIDSALFNVCLDSEDLKDDPYAIVRNFLHGDGENRWFDKSISLQISKDGLAAVNFEHSWGDGVAVLRYVQEIYKDTMKNPFVMPSTKPYDDNKQNVVRLDFHLNDHLKTAITEAKQDYQKTCKSLDIDYLIFNKVGKNMCKKQGVSPDAVMQLGFQVAYYRMTGKFVPTYESCSTAAFKHGRTETVRSCTSATKAFTLALNSSNKPSVSELKHMISECSQVHNQLTKEAAMGQGFDRHLFALKKFSEKTNTLCNIFDDPNYAYLNHIILSTSTLNSPAIFAGGFGPVVKDGLGVGVWSSYALNTKKFPEYFKFGAANAAPQIEGAYLTDGKTESIWDHFAHTHPSKITGHSNLDIAADSYHKYKEDVAALKAVGMQTYRLSIAWTRILPTGYGNVINEAGVQYYKALLKELKDNNIEPLVTLYHWDLPQVLQDQFGGWLNDSISDLFADYAKICFKLFGNDVKWWITINEPKQVCHSGYGAGVWAPGVVSNGIGDYICARNVLLAHAKAYRIYDKQFRAKHKGKVTMVIDSLWYEPASNSSANQEAAERTLQFTIGLYGNPIFNGDWPQVVKERVAMRSRREGFNQSRLPEFSEEEIQLIKGTHDYFALNHYSTSMVTAIKERAIGSPHFNNDISTSVWKKKEWPMVARWFTIVPWGIRKHLNWIKNTYGNPEIVITENGLSDNNGTLADDHRIAYIRDYLSNCLDAIYEDKVNLTRYYLWSIIDDWEWTGGYRSFLGLYRVNFTDPERTRTPRKSASYFTQITKNRCLAEKCSE